MLYVLIVGNIIMLASFAWRFSHLPPQIPLFYSKPWGEEQLADSWMILLLPLFLDLLYFANTLVYNRFFPGNILVKKIFGILNMSLSVGLTFIFVKIIFLTT